MKTRFLPVWLLAVALIGAGWWQGNYDVAQAATYFVTNNIDDGSTGTLRYEIGQATDGDEIHIVTPGPVVLTGGQLNITKSITIQGPDIVVDPTKDPTTDLPAVSGQVAIKSISPNGSVFSIASGKSVSMSHLFISGGTIAGPSHAAGTGDDGFGGGINNAGTLTLNYCTVANNSVYGGNGPDGGGAAYGGGIYSSGTLTLNYSTVKDNLAQGGTGTNAAGTLNAAYGGGIYSTGNTFINSSYIAGNDAFGGGNASTPPVLSTSNGGSAYGGGLAQQNSGTLNLTNSTVYGNFATSGTGSTADGNASGGGVYVNAASLNPLQVTIANNTVTGTATSGAGVSYSGTAALDVNNSVIADNINANDLDASPSFVAHNSPGINVAVSLSPPSHDQYSPTYAMQSTDATYVVDQGDNSLATSLSFDQRGYTRKTGVRVDAGAVESASPAPVHSGATPLSPFYFHVLNGATYFTAADFTSSLTYPDPNTSLQAIVIVSVPDSSVGYFEINGQHLTAGSVISTSDLNNLTYISTGGGDSASLTWQASDGSTVSSVFTSSTPSYTSPPPGYVGGSNGDGTSRPKLSVLAPTLVSPGVYTIGTIESSSAISGGNTQVSVSATGLGFVSVTNPTYTAAAPGPASGSSTITLNESSPGTHTVTITATDINGNTTSSLVVFSTDSSGAVNGFSSDYGGSNGDAHSRPTLTVSSYPSGLTPDGNTTVYATVSSNAKAGTGTASQVIVSVSGDGATVSPNTNPTFFQPAAAAGGTANITLSVSSGLHVVYVTATDINGNFTRYSFTYLGDARPNFGSTPASGQHVAFGSQYSEPFSASDTDFFVPNKSISPEPLRFQVDQEGYAASVSDPIDYNIKVGNIGTFGASNYQGGNFGTTLTSNYILDTGIGKTISKPGVYALRVSLTDYWGLGQTYVYTVIVDPPPAPTWTGPGAVVAQINDPSFNLNLNDYVTGLYSGATPKYSVISGLPAWADFSPTTGIISGTPTSLGTSHVTVTVDDQLGNVISNTFDIQVVNGGPIFDSPPTPDEGATINFAVGSPISIPVAAHDPNGDTVGWSISGWPALSIAPSSGNSATITSAALTLADLGNHAITLTASDSSNDSVRHFTIKVTNGNTPTITTTVQSTYNITAGSNFTLPLNATDADMGDTLTYVVTGGGSITPGSLDGGPPTTLPATYNFNAVPAGSYTITITVKDANNNVSNPVTFKINAGTGTPPSISLTPAGPSFNATTGVSIPMIKATATDPDAGETLTFTLSGAPVGMTLSSPSSFSGVASGDPKSVTLQWTPTSGQTGSYTFDVIVTDSQGFTDSVPVTINVTASTVDHAPTVVNPVSATGYVGIPFNLPVQASDPDGDGITFSAANLPAGLFIDPITGIIAGTPTTVGTYNNVQVTVKDDSSLTNGPLSTTVTFTITISQVNPPLISDKSSIVGGSPYSVSPGASFIKQFTATDKDYPENLTFTASYSDDNGATNTPLNGSTYWSQFNQFGPNSQGGTTASSTFTWNNIPVGVHVVTVVVTDGSGNTDQVTFTVQSGNAPQLTVSPTDPVTVIVGSPLPAITATATDADNNENLSFTLEGAPGGMTLSSPSSFSAVPANTATAPVTIQWTPTSGQAGTYTFNVVVTDKDGLRATVPVTVTVMTPHVPTLNAVAGPITMHVGEVISPITLSSSDTDAGDTATFGVVITPNSGLTGTLTPQTYAAGPPTTASSNLQLSASAIGNYQVDVSVTDSQSHTTTKTFYVNVVNAPPVITPIANQSVSVGDSVSVQVNATDPDAGDTLTYQLVGAPAWLSINSSGLITSSTLTAGQMGSYPVTVSVDDGNGHVVTTNFTLTVSALGVPTLSSVAGPITLHVGDVFTNMFTSTDTDASDTLTFNAEIFKFNTGTSTWDSTGVQTLLDQGYNGGPPTTADAQLSWPATTAGNYRVNVSVTDSQGHTTTTTFFINVVNGAPVITPIANQTVSLGDNVNIPVTATDPDGDTLNYQLVNSPVWLQISNTGVITNSAPITFSLIGSHSVTVSVDDGINPAVTATFTLTVSAAGVPTLNATPSISSPVTVNVDQVFTNNFTSTDSDANDSLTFSVSTTQTSGPAGTVTASFLDQSYVGTPTTTAVSQLNWSANQPGTYKVVATVTDSQSHATTYTFFMTVKALNAPPVVSNPGTWIASVGSFSTTSVFASDSDGDTLTWSSSNLPGWVTLDSSTGVLSGTPGPGNVGTSSATVSVTDGVNTVSVTFEIKVVASGVPTLQATPSAPANPEQVLLGSGYSKIFLSTDGDYPETLTFSATVTPMAGTGAGGNYADATMIPMYQSGSSSTGTTSAASLNWTPDTSGTYLVVISVTDTQSHVTSLTFSIHVSSPPTIKVNNTTSPVTVSATPELPITPLPVEVSDPDEHETLAVTLDSNAPSGMTVKSPNTFSNVAANTPQNTELDFTPTISQANTSYTFNVIVTDSSGKTATQQVTVNVGAVNARPVITSPTSGSTLNVVTGHAVSLPVVATDAEGDTLTYAATGLPAGLSIDSGTGIISGTVTAGSGTNTVTVTVDDGYHISPASSVTFKIVVGSTNHAPTLSSIANQTLIVGQTLNVQPTASDPDNDLLTYSQTGLPASWATFDTSTGHIGGGPAVEGTWVVTVTVDDGYGGTASQSFTLKVNGPFSASYTSSGGYATITYTVTNTTGATISPTVTGSLTGGGYTDNTNAFFNASQGSVSDQWANPILQRQLDPTKNTRILNWTVGSLAPGASATLTISVPINGNTPTSQQLTNQWSVNYGTSGGPVTINVAPVTILTAP